MPRKPPPPEGLVLKILREALGWKQEDLAREAGMDKDEISDLERGRRPLSRERLGELAKVMNPSAVLVEGLSRSLDWLLPAPEAPGRPPDLSIEERQAIAGAGMALGWTAAEAIRAQWLEEHIRHDRSEAERLWQTLKDSTPAERRLLADKGPGFTGWALVETLCAESERAAASNAGRALEVAELALAAAGRTADGIVRKANVQGYAWAHVANARRVANDLRGADEAFSRVWDLWRAGGPAGAGPLEESRLFDLEASLRRDQRRLLEALRLLDQALDCCRTPEMEGRVLLKRAFTLELMGRIEEAVEALRQAALRVDGEKEPRHLFAIWFNMTVNTLHLGWLDRAEGGLVEARELALRLGNELDLVRVLWLEARVSAGLGRLEAAESALEQVVREFTARGLVFDAALAALELARLFLRQSRTTEARELALRIAPVFQRLEVGREALEAVRLFWQAAVRETATVEMAEQALAELYQARPRPGGAG
jgi:transcriptional regulator with XRE-family HTH domain